MTADTRSISPPYPKADSSSEALTHASGPDDQSGQLSVSDPVTSASSTAVTPDDHSVKNEPEHCDHPIHPAYAGTYVSPFYPSCQYQECLRVARKPAMDITTRGGSDRWRERISFSLEGHAQKSELQQHKFLTGHQKRRDRAGKDLHCNDDGTAVSFPRGKTALWKKIAELEVLRDGEAAWEKRNAALFRDEDVLLQLMKAKSYTATTALLRWSAYHKKLFDKVTDQSATASRKRGREMEIATHLDFPPPDNYYETRTYYLTPEQRVFVDAAAAPDSSAADDHYVSPPSRKRRRLDTTVAFDSQIYVRDEVDVDLLFAPAGLSSEFLEDAPAPPPPKRLLRSTKRDEKRHMHPPPRRAHVVKGLETQEKNTVGGVRRSRSARTREGYERIDTSGFRFKNRWLEWDAYREDLTAEAGKGGRRVDGEAGSKSVGGEGVVEQMEGVEEVLEDEGIEEDVFPTDEEVAAAEKQIREAQLAMSQPLHAKFRPHGGMASAFALGSFVGGAAVGLVRRAGLW